MNNKVEILAAGPTIAGRWLAANRTDDGWADLSGQEWGSSVAVIDGIVLYQNRLVGHPIRSNFVNCTLTNSEFSNLATDGHFWGGGNKWQNCSLSGCVLRSVISPQNLFEDCKFENLTFGEYVACETLFERCHFTNCIFESLRTRPKSRARWVVERMGSLGKSLQFIDCEFVRPEFRNCAFADTAFSKCTFVEPNVVACDFTGVGHVRFGATPNWNDRLDCQGTTWECESDQNRSNCGGPLSTRSHRPRAPGRERRDYEFDGGKTPSSVSACR